MSGTTIACTHNLRIECIDVRWLLDKFGGGSGSISALSLLLVHYVCQNCISCNGVIHLHTSVACRYSPPTRVAWGSSGGAASPSLGLLGSASE